MGCSSCGKRYVPSASKVLVPPERRYKVSKLRAARMKRLQAVTPPTEPAVPSPSAKDQSLAPGQPEPLTIVSGEPKAVTPLGYAVNPQDRILAPGESDE